VKRVSESGSWLLKTYQRFYASAQSVKAGLQTTISRGTEGDMLLSFSFFDIFFLLFLKRQFGLSHL